MISQTFTASSFLYSSFYSITQWRLLLPKLAKTLSSPHPMAFSPLSSSPLTAFTRLDHFLMLAIYLPLASETPWSLGSLPTSLAASSLSPLVTLNPLPSLPHRIFPRFCPWPPFSLHFSSLGKIIHPLLHLLQLPCG